MSEEVQKRGFMYYLNNPGEAAKKLLPFIDVDAMMAENKERYKELGVDPEMGKNVIGAILNPVAHGVGASVGLGSKSLLSAFHKRKAIKQLSDDVLSPEGIQRYINNATSNTKYALKELEREKEIVSIVLKAQRGKNKAMFSTRLKKINQDILYAKGNIDYLKTPDFIDEYTNIIKHKMKDTPLNIKVLPGHEELSGMRPVGQLRTQHGLESKLWDGSTGGYTNLGTRAWDTSTYGGFQGVPSHFKSTIEIAPREAMKIGKGWGGETTTPVHEMKHSIQEALRGYRYSTKKAIPKNEKGRAVLEAEGRFMDTLFPEGVKHTTRAKYLLKPHEISARLTELRANPSKTSWAYKDLKKVFRTDKKVQWAKDNLWAASPASLMDYAKDKK